MTRVNSETQTNLNVGDLFALKLQQLWTQGDVDDKQPLLKIDYRNAAAKAPFQFDTVRATLHRTNCSAIPQDSKSALFARWRINNDEMHLLCDKCQPTPLLGRVPHEHLTSDLFYGVLSVINQFAKVLREQGSAFTESENGRCLQLSIEKLYASFDEQQKQLMDTIISTLVKFEDSISEYEANLDANSNSDTKN